MATRDTLRTVLDAGSDGKRLDELSLARVIGKAATQVHAAQQKAGGKSVGPITPAAITFSTLGELSLELPATGSTAGYTAPEGTGEKRSDVFSLGTVLWEALTGERLFDAMNEAAVKAAISEREIKPPSEHNANIPAELSAICMKALARNAADRYQSAKVLGVELEEFLEAAGCADNNEKVAAFLGELRKKKPTLPPPSILAKEPKPEPKPEPVVAEEAKAEAVTTVFEKAAPAPAPAPVAAAAAAVEEVAPAKTPSLPPIEQVAAFAPPVAVTPTPPPMVPMPPVLPESARSTISVAVPPPPAPPPVPTPEPSHAVPETVASTGSAPHPASVVSLPPPGGRESKADVLSNWAWKTDSHAALTDDDDDLYAQPTSRKPIVYMIGGGLALALIVTIIAVGFGGSKKADKKPAPAAAMQESAAPAPAVAPAPAPAPTPPTPAVAAADPGSGSGPVSDTGSGSGSDPGSGSGSAVAAAPAPAPVPAPVPAPPPTPAPPPPPPKVAVADPPPPPPKPAKAEKPKPEPKAKPKIVDPFAAKHAPEKPTRVAAHDTGGTKTDGETAYRVGLQQFARGDTNGALASLRTSLASNPNYPPTWRGLGLVFEKLGERDQARAAFKRYLQLAPGAPDGEQIRGRLERLGS